MAAGAELAIKEVNDSGLFLNGSKITTIRADSTCVDAGAATAAAERLVSSDKVSAIIGDTCSGASAAGPDQRCFAEGRCHGFTIRNVACSVHSEE